MPEAVDARRANSRWIALGITGANLGRMESRASRKHGLLPLPAGERGGVRGLRTIDGAVPPHPRPLPVGERESRRAGIESVLITKVCVDMNGTCFSVSEKLAAMAGLRFASISWLVRDPSLTPGARPGVFSWRRKRMPPLQGGWCGGSAGNPASGFRGEGKPGSCVLTPWGGKRSLDNIEADRAGRSERAPGLITAGRISAPRF